MLSFSFIFRLVQSSNDLLKHLILAMFLWSFASFCCSLLMIQMELVKFNSEPLAAEFSFSIHCFIIYSHTRKSTL